MKTFLILFVLLISLPSMAITIQEVEQFLAVKGLSLRTLQSQGAQVFMGEVSGHINAVPFAKVAVVVTESEAIPKSEIEGVTFNGGSTLGSLSSLRVNGQYITKDDVKATIVLQ